MQEVKNTIKEDSEVKLIDYVNAYAEHNQHPSVIYKIRLYTAYLNSLDKLRNS